jgi:hypothetical protein
LTAAHSLKTAIRLTSVEWIWITSNHPLLRGAASRIIGAFFGDVASYFRFKCKDNEKFQSEFSLGVFDAEIKALHRLAREKSPASFDDRRFSIEIQTTDTLDLTILNPLALIAPITYFDDASFRNCVETKWKCAPIGYPIFTLNSNQYFYAVYERVEQFFMSRGYL